jgi:hypothetical protein
MAMEVPTQDPDQTRVERHECIAYGRFPVDAGIRALFAARKRHHEFWETA